MTDHTPATDPGAQVTGEPEPAAPEALSFWDRWGELLLASGVLALGIVVLVGTQDIKVRQGVVVSPRIVPTIVGIGLVILSIWYAFDIFRAPHRASGGEDSEDVDPEAQADWSVIGTIALALVVYAVLIKPAGFVIASALLFVISSFAMGSRRYLRDTAIGVLLSVAVFLLFDGWLQVRLPDGILEGLL